MGNVVSRDATALRAPPSTRCVPASSPRRDVGIFSCTDNPIASERLGQASSLGSTVYHSRKYKKGPVHCGRIP